ncbi:MAG TPA: exodeoxyribonuclease VII large subunit [Candidatus Binatia bacterium]|nr:exodeoxyribonuclease VII large subunit [Candidatus Binatia bacterium]
MKKEADALPLFREVPRFLTVSELNRIIKGTLEEELNGLWVVGEISNFRIPPSGHYYFTLKDDKCQISAVLFRRQGLDLTFTPENGMEVLCFGKVSLYPVRGDLQLYVEALEPRGQGALYLAFEQLKKKLSAEGLFSEERKRALPFLPRSIGIVTSEKGAALRDMLRIISDRYPDRRIVVCPVKVQGEGAAEKIASAITDLGGSGEVEVTIVGRGGGSLEDLWAFNEEVVARSIFASPVPVISAVGHEIDFTICDFVADVRAPTPTAAAELVVPRKAELLEQVMALEGKLLRSIRRKVDLAREDWRGFVKRLADPERKLRETQQRVDELSVDLLRRFRDRMRQLKDRLVQEGRRLNALSPLAVLDRGYSITHKIPEEKIIKDADSLAIGDLLRITFAKGKSICRVEGKE